MIELERIEDLCERLALGTMARQLAHVADQAARDSVSFQEFFERLLQAEYHERKERTRAMLTRTAGFPTIKTLEQYDFEFATGAPKAMITELTSLAFIETRSECRAARSIGSWKDSLSRGARIQSRAKCD